ncbi:MAG: hypothetical protein ABW217_22420 [Polyangiaceae bacterium]
MPGASGTLLALALGASVVEGAVGVDTEVAAGRAPVEINGPERNSVSFTGTPAVGLRVTDETHTFTTTYAPRFYYRLPNVLDVNRPLVLHQVDLSYENLIDISTQWITAAALDIGELDYTSASQIFDPQTSGLQQDVEQIARVSGDSTLRVTTSRRSTWQLSLQGEYTTPINTDDDQPAPTEPVNPDLPTVVPPAAATTTILKSASGTVRPHYRHVVSRRDFITSELRLSYQWFSNGGEFIVVSPQLGWERRLSYRSTLVTSAGPLYVVVLGAAPGADDDNFIGGSGLVELRSTLSRGDGHTLTGALSGNVDWFFDPLAGTSDPRATAQVSAVAQFGRKWTLSPVVSFSTLLREESGGAAAIARTDASVLRADLPVRYEISDNLRFNFGLRSSFRGGRLGTDEFSLTETYEAWAYVGLALAFGTSGERTTWIGF